MRKLFFVHCPGNVAKGDVENFAVLAINGKEAEKVTYGLTNRLPDMKKTRLLNHGDYLNNLRLIDSEQM